MENSINGEVGWKCLSGSSCGWHTAQPEIPDWPSAQGPASLPRSQTTGSSFPHRDSDLIIKDLLPSDWSPRLIGTRYHPNPAPFLVPSSCLKSGFSQAKRLPSIPLPQGGHLARLRCPLQPTPGRKIGSAQHITLKTGARSLLETVFKTLNTKPTAHHA